MANIIDVPMVGQSYHLKDWSIDCQRTLNLYPQAVESGNAQQVSALLPTEGLTKLYEFTGSSQQYDGKIRGIYALTDRVLVVVSMRLVIIQDGDWRDVGYVRGLDRVTFADNGLEVFMTGDDEYGYSCFVYNIEDDAVTQIDVDPDSLVESDTSSSSTSTDTTTADETRLFEGAVTSITPDEDDLEIFLTDGDKSIDVTVLPDDATDKTYTAISSNTAVATVAVTSTGIKITPVAYGVATITLKANDGSNVSAKIKTKVTFIGAVTKISPSTLSLNMEIGDDPSDLTVTVLPTNANNKTYTAVSADTSIATVAITSTGITVTALKQGETTITLAAQDGSGVTTEIAVVISGNGFFGASSVAFLDSRFVWSVPGTGRIQWSKLLSHKTDALSYATAETRSDNLVKVIANNGQLWLIGEKSTEIWNSTGSSDLPFARQSGAYLQAGCNAKDSIAVFGSSLAWLAQSDFGGHQIVMTRGYQITKISNHAIEMEISRYDKTSDAYAFSYQRDGHSFYVITFPTAKKTWVYDGATGLWHERGWYNATDSNVEHIRYATHCYFNEQHLVGDWENQKLYLLDPDAQNDDDVPIIRERTTPCVTPNGSRLIFDELQVFCQVGQDDNSKPQIMLDWSDDRGKTWSNDRIAEISNDIGAIGEYEKRVTFRRLGQSFGRVFRVRMSDAGRLILLGAKARIR